MAKYALCNSSGEVVTIIGSALPEAVYRGVCPRSDRSPASSGTNTTPFTVYEVNIGSEYYYYDIGTGGCAITSRLNKVSGGTTVRRTFQSWERVQAPNTTALTYRINNGDKCYVYVANKTSSVTKRVVEGTVLYDDSGNSYVVRSVYDVSITAQTLSVDGEQVGNIAIYDASTNKLLEGSVSKSTSTGVSSYTATITSVNSSAQFKVVATALIGTSTTTKSTWHNNYFYNGLKLDNMAITSGVSFSEGTASYTMLVSEGSSHVIQCLYGRKYGVTVNHGAGVASSTVSYSRSVAPSSYVSASISPLSLSGAGTLYVEAGQTISISASSANGYVFDDNAITFSTTGYGTIGGSGNTSINSSKQCVNNTTMTIKGAQYTITPTFYNSGQSSWGTPTINGSTGPVVLAPNTTYTLGFTSSTANTLAAAVSHWVIDGSNYTTSFTTGSKIDRNLTAYIYLNQTKWQLTVSQNQDNSWGDVYIGSSGTAKSGWFASGTDVVVRYVPKLSSTIAPTAYAITYNGITTSCGNVATITTASNSYEAVMSVKRTKWQMRIAYNDSTQSGWGEIAFRRNSDSSWVTNLSESLYVGEGDVVELRFTPTESLTSTIHPQVKSWTILTQSPTPTAASDGSSIASVTLGAFSSDFIAYVNLESTWRKVSVLRSDSNSTTWGNFYLGASGVATTAYYPPGSTITIRFDRNTSLDMTVRPQVNAINIGTESQIVGADGFYSYTYTLPTNTKSDLQISCSVKQTAWPVSVTSGGNGSITVRRVNAAGVVVESVTATNSSAKVLYLQYGSSEYIGVSATPNTHYQFDSYTTNNLVGSGPYRLATAGNATISGTFSRNDFRVLCQSDNSTICSTYEQTTGASSVYFPKSRSEPVVVFCKINPDYADDYKVSSFSVSGMGSYTPQYNSSIGCYYVDLYDIRTDVTVTAHLVPTHFKLTVTVGPENKTDFGRVIVSVNGAECGENGYTGRVREGMPVSVVFYGKYGGRVLQITSDNVENPNQSGSAIAFLMPSSDCSVSLTLGPKETYQLTVGVMNIAEGQAATIPGIVKVASRTYPDVVIGSTDDTGIAQTFRVYKNEEYSLIVSGVNDYLSRRYAFVGWRDADATIPDEYETVLNILNTDEDSIVRYATYNARDNGTITIEYAKKVGDTITAIDPSESMYQLRIDNTEDMYDDHSWLIGADVVIGYTAMGSAYDEDGDACKWTPVQVDVALVDDEYGTPNAIWDDGLLTQDGSFRMLGNMKVRLVLTNTKVPGYVTMNVGLRQSTILMGEVSLFSTEMDAYTTDHTGAKAIVQKMKKAVIMAAPRPGYAFAGWYTKEGDDWVPVVGAKAVYEIDYVTSPMTVYYAQFVASTVSNLKEWNGNAAIAKTCEWRSKVYVGSQFFRLSCCRVYSDAYPVKLKVFASSSPNNIFGDNARVVEVTINNQNPRRLPMMRPEKYIAFSISGYSRINHVGIASSMEALK